MKKLIIFFVVLSVWAFTALSQTTYGNEWINKNQSYYKIKIIQDGIYRVTYTTLANAGFPVGLIEGIDFQIFYHGQPIPIYTTTNGSLGAGFYIEFFGQKNDGAFDTQLYDDPKCPQPEDCQPQPYTSLFTDTAVYFLTWNDTAANNPRYLDTINDLSAPPAKENYFMYNAIQVYTNKYYRGSPGYLSSQGPIHASNFEKGEGWVYNRYKNTRTFTVSTPYVYSSGPLAELSTTVLGWSNTAGYPDHHVRVDIGSSGFGDIDTTFDGYNLIRLYTQVNPNNLDNNKVKISAVGDISTTDFISISHIEIKYPREFNFGNQSTFHFNISPSGSKKYLEITNFNEGASTPVLYDMNNRLRMTGVVQNDTTKFVLPASSNERDLFLTSQSAINNVGSLESVNFTDFKNIANQGNYIILTHPSLLSGGYVDAYKLFRESSTGGNYDVTVVLIDELYDHFGYGIAKHPVAIRNFIQFALDSFSTPPELLFIIGLGLDLRTFNTKNATNYANNLIPTWGDPASDNLLVASSSSYLPQIMIGRIAARVPDDIRIYLNKAKEHRAFQTSTVQTLANKEWMKRILHFGGGSNVSEQNMFKGYLNNYKKTIEDTLFGGIVKSFFKGTTDPIQIGFSHLFDSLIIDGVTLMTFFGHSSANSFDFSVDAPENYNNKGKYPFMLSNGCYSGNFFTTEQNIGHRFVMIEDKGAIAFLSTTSLGFATYDNMFSSNFYKRIGQKNYGYPIGACIKKTFEDMYSANNFFKRMTIQQFALNGDPAIILNAHDKPDYVVYEPSKPQAWIEPTVITANMKDFEIKVRVTNIGRAIQDSFYIKVERQFPNNSFYAELFRQEFPATLYKDTFSFTILTDPKRGLGINKLKITVDANDEIPEMEDVINNTTEIQLLILSDDVLPVHPYEFGIVFNSDFTLKASTVNIFAPEREYVMEIDTTELFNSPLKKSTKIKQIGGILKWQPNIQLIDSTVYYWRVSIDPNFAVASDNHNNNDLFYKTRQENQVDAFNWRYSSFIYLAGSSPGWNQSHYFQYLKDEYANLELPSNRQFKFVDDVKDIFPTSFNYNFYGTWDAIGYSINGVVKHNASTLKWSGGFGCGITIVVFDSTTGLPWNSYFTPNYPYSWYPPYQDYGQYGNKHWGTTKPLPAFDFRDSSRWGGDFYEFCPSCDAATRKKVETIEWRRRIKAIIDTVPDGNYILMYFVASWYGPFPEQWDSALLTTIENLGSTQIRNVENRSPWAFFVKKGDPGTVVEAYDTYTQPVSFHAFITGAWDQGYLQTPLIGPAGKWGSLKWGYYTLEDCVQDITQKGEGELQWKKGSPGNDCIDEVRLDVFGVDNNHIETLLLSNVSVLDTTLDFIQAKDYPYLKLQFYTMDDSLRTPAQVDYLRVLYDPLPEAALNPAAHFTYYKDTLAEGDEYKVSIAVENISDIAMDSLLIHYTISNLGSDKTKIISIREDSLRVGDTMIATVNFSTHGYPKNNSLLINVNPNDDQPEQFHYNNLGFMEYYVTGDVINPLLDVTFDGRHVMNGDIVSAKPNIIIKLKDENKYLALDDTSLLNVFIEYPDGESKRISYNNNVMQFLPASSSGSSKTANLAEIQLDPVLNEDGAYQLIVQGQDVSGNQSGKLDYKIEFEVINKPMITQVLNYPNPFTTATKFVFTLTGSNTPTYFKIQIMTITGKVVREIMLDELGQIYVGPNITEFAWDGTDTYGDKLANGLYLYRVVASIDGAAIEHYNDFNSDKGIDKYFKSDFGKMYLMR